MPHSDVAATTTTMTAQLPQPGAHPNGRAMDLDERAVPRSLKRHKVLPHPGDYSYIAAEDITPSMENLEPAHRSSASSFAQDTASDRMSNGELPPTPPGYSRSTASSQSALPSSPTYVASPAQSDASVLARSSGTPPNQKSPPTPDVTPPARERRPKAARPTLLDRFPSKATTDSRGGSRSESFRTAQEFIGDSDDDDERSTVKLASSTGTRTPQAAPRSDPMSQVRKNSSGGATLGLLDESQVPKVRQEFSSFDGDWASPQGEVEQEWDENLNRNVTIRRRRPRAKAAQYREVDEEPGGAPLIATKISRSVPPQERTNVRSSPGPERGRKRTSNIISASETSTSIETKRSSALSTKSGTSTVVDTARYESSPRRQKTLRHVKKQLTLRDSIADFPANSTILAVTQPEAMLRQSRPPVRAFPARTESVASTGTMNSISSRKARRDVWKNGGIPVVVIPDRTASSRSTKAPSLRSTSSRQSRRSNSLSSAQGPSQAKDMVPTFETQRGRSPRSMSLSSSSFVTDQLTMDYPPIVPRRTSSLSASTSRNGSRAGSLVGSQSGSLTTESLRAHNAVQKRVADSARSPRVAMDSRPSIASSTNGATPLQLQPVRSMESQRSGMEHRANTDSNGDPFFGKRPATFNTPFSQASVETNGTGTVTHSIADVAEARVVNIFPHQNKSVLMVHNGSKPTEVAHVEDEWQPGDDSEGISTNKVLQVQTVVNVPLSTQRGPVTPTQVPRIQMEDIDSPLRNPREPPQPPAIQLIPATPSGLTPAHEENMRDGYFPGATRRPSLVRRALGLRSAPENGTPRRISLLRALSISRNIRRDTAENPGLTRGHSSTRSQYPTADDPPEDDTRLHPFWRPVSQEGESDGSDSEEWERDFPDDVDQMYVYPATQDRQPPRRRDSITARLRSTFSILPINDDRHYISDEQRDTDRRTIKRTPSGNLRVMRYPDNHQHESPPPSRGLSRRWSLSSKNREDRPATAPPRPEQRTWGPEKQVDERGRRVFPGWQEKLSQMRPSSLQRRLSEHRRQKRTEVLRQKISGPQEVRDGVEDVIKRNTQRVAPPQERQQAEISTRINNTVYNYPSKEEVWYGRRI